MICIKTTDNELFCDSPRWIFKRWLYINEAMTYKEYFIRAEFDEVWRTLREVYGESDDSRPLYKAVFDSVC